MSLHTKGSSIRQTATNEYLNRMTRRQSKVRGTQMLNFKIDLTTAREKRKRQLKYAQEIRSGARSEEAREIDSVTRIVVQGFRNLIDCERCALFLMDPDNNELYFKPVGDVSKGNAKVARLKEIRFPATSGVAGWCATNKEMLNIKNAYHDFRFNADIDKKTGFRTRTILCHPVISSSSTSSRLLGVIQMVNKLKKGDAREIRERAKRTKTSLSGNKNKGYQSCFEHFSTEDEETLSKCCEEVSKSLEGIFSRKRRKQNEVEEMVLISDEHGESPLQLAQDLGSTEISIEQSTETDSMSFAAAETPPPFRRDSSRRRSSVGSLAQFVKRNSITDCEETPSGQFASGKTISEVTSAFRFRVEDTVVTHQKERERRQSDPMFQVAQAKRTRIRDYGEKIKEENKKTT